MKFKKKLQKKQQTKLEKTIMKHVKQIWTTKQKDNKNNKNRKTIKIIKNKKQYWN